MATTTNQGSSWRKSSGEVRSALGWIAWHGFWIIISLVCLGLGVNNYFQERAFLAKAELDTGTITQYELHVRHDGKSEYCPRIEFTDSTGEPVAVAGNDCPNAPNKSKIGTKVQVYWDPSNPNAYEEKSATTGYDGLIFGLIGAVFFGLFWFIPAVAQLLGWLRGGANLRATPASGLNQTLQQDAARYHAHQVARERAQQHAQPPQSAPADPLAAEEARLAQLKQQEAELQRKIDQSRQQKGQ